LDNHAKRKLQVEAKKFIYDEPYLYRLCPDGMLRTCIAKEKVGKILFHCHGGNVGGHFGPSKTAAKVWQTGYYWPTMFADANAYVRRCDRCQRTGNLSRRLEMPTKYLIECEPFDLWGIDFMGPFIKSDGKQFILVAVDYFTRWVEAEACVQADGKTVEKFVKKNIFSRFGCPRAIVSDGGKHFNNTLLNNVLKKYGVKHRVTMPYHPQANGLVELANREIKGILEKTVGHNRKDWAYRLDDSFWAYRTSYKTVLGASPFRLVYGKPCHLPIEMENKSYWATRMLRTDLKQAGKGRYLQLAELEEWRSQAYENSKLYKERVKQYHDRRIRARTFEQGDRLLLFDSRLSLFPGKLKSKWIGPYMVKQAFESGMVELVDKNGNAFKVNGHRVKHYYADEIRKETEDNFDWIGGEPEAEGGDPPQT